MKPLAAVALMAGVFLFMIGALHTILFRDYSTEVMTAVLGGAVILAGLFWVFLAVRTSQALAERSTARKEAQLRREVAIQNGGAAGQLAEVPPGEGAGDLSLQEGPGALGLASRTGRRR